MPDKHFKMSKVQTVIEYAPRAVCTSISSDGDELYDGQGWEIKAFALQNCIKCGTSMQMWCCSNSETAEASGL